MTIIGASAPGLAAIADAIDPALLVADYDPAVGGVLNKHGFNLLWTGLATIIGTVLIWISIMTAITVTAMVGGARMLAISCSSICRATRTFSRAR